MIPGNPAGTLAMLPQDNPLVAAAAGTPPVAMGQPQPDMGQNPPATPQMDTPMGGAPLGANPRNAAALRAFTMGKAPNNMGQPSSVHAGNIASDAAKTMAEHPEAAAQPGGVMRAIVSGALGAMSKVGEHLGDVAAVGTVPAGAGALTGIARTLQARGQREMAERQMADKEAQTASEIDKNHVLTAEANVRMMHEQRLIHNMGLDAMDTSMKNGRMQLATMKAVGAQYDEIATGLTAAQAEQYIKDKKLNPATDTAIPTGIKELGTDKNGQRQAQLTYSVVKVPETVNLNSDDAKQAVAYLNANNPRKDGGKWDGMSMTGAQFNFAMQQAHDNVAFNLAKEKAALDMGIATDELKRGNEALAFKNDPLWTNALANARQGDIMGARAAILSQMKTNPELAQKYQNLDNDLRESLGYTEKKGGEKDYLYDNLLAKWQEKRDAAGNFLVDNQKKIDTAASPKEVLSNVEAAKSRLAQSDDPNDRAALQAQIVQGEAAAKRMQDYDVEEANRKRKEEMALNEEDIPQLVDMAGKYQMTPEKMAGLRKDTRAHLISELHRQFPDWSEATYNQRYKMQQSLASDKITDMGGQVDSLNRYALHLNAANNAIQELRNPQVGGVQSPFLNKAINSIKKGAVGYEQAQAFLIKAETVKDEFLNLIRNGHVPPTDQEERLAASINDSRTPAELQGAFRAMTELAAARAKSMNGRYNTIMGGQGNIPGLIQPDTAKVFRNFGINPDEIFNTTGATSFSNTPSEAKAIRSLPPAPKGTVYLQYGGKVAPVPENQVDAAIAKGAVRVQ
jgi:hypothetical protein